MEFAFELIGTLLQIIWLLVKGLFLPLLEFIKSIPSSAGDFLLKVIVDNYAVTNIVWIDTILITIATTTPALIFLIISLLKIDINLDKKMQGVITVGFTILILALFQSVIFWIIVALLITIAFGLTIYSRFVKTEKI